MAKRFKLRICRAITATWQSCRSKDPSILPAEVPVLSFSRLNADDQDPLHRRRRRKSFKHHASAAFISIGACGLQPTSDEEFKWQKEDKWHVVAKMYEQPPIHRRKICNSSASEDDLPFNQPTPPAPPPSAAEENHDGRRKKKKKKKIKKTKFSNFRTSTSSAESVWFSSEGGGGGPAAARDEDETETLVSSGLSLSTLTDTSSNSHYRIKNRRRVSKGGGARPPSTAAAAEEVEIPARLSMLKKLIPCAVEGKVKESYAVVKRSENPYEDFKNSMMDMILEKQMFDHKDLEQLLQCFLSLNSRKYHGIIVGAFTEIWETIFSPAPAGPQNRRRRQVLRIAGGGFPE